MEVGDWITLGAVVVALSIGVASILHTRSLQIKERRERRLNEIIEWANDLVNCSSKLNIPLATGIDRTTMLIYGHSNIYFEYMSVNARSSYIEKMAVIFGAELLSAVTSVISKLEEYIKILEDNIESLEKDDTYDLKAAENCELKLYDLARALIEEVAEIKTKDIS